MSQLRSLTERIVAFRDERDWQQFHNPKDLALSLALEAGEVLELFQWKNGADIDAVVRDGKIVTQPEKRASSDQSVKGWKQLAKQDPEAARALTDAIIKNTYRTLMTRGMRGCYVYFTDRQASTFLRPKIGP